MPKSAFFGFPFEQGFRILRRMRKQYHSRVVGSDTLIWDVHRLVRLSKHITPELIALSDLAELDENWWYPEPTQVPTPRSLVAHMALVKKTSLAYPVILCDKGRLMDGMHRAVKALLEGRPSIGAVRFETTPAPDFKNVALTDLPYGDETVD